MMDADKMTHSALVRYVRISETVYSSDAFLSLEDRATIIQEMTQGTGNPTVKEIEECCERFADAALETNMVRAGVLRYAMGL